MALPPTNIGAIAARHPGDRGAPCPRAAHAGLALIALVSLTLSAAAGGAAPPDAVVAPLITRDLIGMPGKEVTMETVEYPPGGKSPPHSHHAQVFVYVLEGSVLMQMKDGEKVTLHPGGHVLRRPCRHLPRREKCDRYCGRARKTSPTLS